MNQWLNPLKRGTGSNLVDMGRAAVRVDSIHEETTPTTTIDAGVGGHGEGLRRSRGEAAAAELGADPANRDMVNVGTTPESPSSSCRQHEDGQARRRLTAPGWDGGSVVVRGRESRSHGEGVQRDRSIESGRGGRW